MKGKGRGDSGDTSTEDSNMRHGKDSANGRFRAAAPTVCLPERFTRIWGLLLRWALFRPLFGVLRVGRFICLRVTGAVAPSALDTCQTLPVGVFPIGNLYA
jgi:hypothetical protein